MAETIYTPDGKTHVLVGATTPASIVREYCGAELADRIAQKLDYTDRKEQSDLLAYEADLDHLHRAMQDWVDDLEHIAVLCDDRKTTKSIIRTGIRDVISNIEYEM